jgi:hypothetical protein
MAANYYLGDVPISRQEWQEKQSFGTIKEAIKAGQDLEFRNGKVSKEKVNEYTQIGIGKPLSLEIVGGNLGDIPGRKQKTDILITSGMKGVADVKAAPKAINYLRKDQGDNNDIDFGADNAGSPIIYYTPSLDTAKPLFTIEAVADRRFKKSIFEQLSKNLSAAGNLPIFVPGGVFALAGAKIAGLVGNIIDLFDKSEIFLHDHINDITFGYAQEVDAVPKHIIVHENDQVFEQYVPKYKNIGGNEKWVAVHKSTGKTYEGPEAYIILSLDGRNRDHELKDFSSTYISAALMERFYGKEQSADFTIIQDAAQLYNDLNYYRKVQRLQKDIEKKTGHKLNVGKEKERMEAYKKNIQSEAFRSLIDSQFKN